MPEKTPEVRSQSLRAQLAEVLRQGPHTARELSQAVGVPEKDVAPHLEHLARSLRRQGETLVVEPAACLACEMRFDDRKRMTYDTLGADQFALGLQVLNDTVRGPDDLLRAVLKVKRRSAEQEHEGKLRLSGATVITASLDDLSPASASRWLGAELQSVAMTQDMTLELDSRSTLSVGPQLLTKEGLGGSSLRLGFRRQLSGFAAVELSTSLLSGAAALGISANRRLSRHSVGVASASVTPWGEAWLANLTFKATRQLTMRTLGEAALGLGSSLQESSLIRSRTLNP